MYPVTIRLHRMKKRWRSQTVPRKWTARIVINSRRDHGHGAKITGLHGLRRGTAFPRLTR